MNNKWLIILVLGSLSLFSSCSLFGTKRGMVPAPPSVLQENLDIEKYKELKGVAVGSISNPTQDTSIIGKHIISVNKNRTGIY